MVRRHDDEAVLPGLGHRKNIDKLEYLCLPIVVGRRLGYDAGVSQGAAPRCAPLCAPLCALFTILVTGSAHASAPPASPGLAAQDTDDPQLTALIGEPLASPPRPAPTSTPWILRNPPTRHTIEIGLAVGALFASPRHGLINPDTLRESEGMFFQRYSAFTPDFALRVAYFPRAFFGLELEGSLAPTFTREYRERANIYGLHAQVITQLTRRSAVPYLLAGGGVLGTRGALGLDRDPEIHLGVGGKLFVDDHLLVRIELRDTLSAGASAALVQTFQLSISLALRLRPRRLTTR